MSDNTWIVVARIVRPQGRRGEVLAEILTDFPERFALRKRLFLLGPADGADAREVTLEEHRLHQRRIALKFAGIDSISQAETLRDCDVAIPAEERAPLDADTFYVSDLIGCNLVDLRSGLGPIGRITGVDREATTTPLLVLRPADSAEAEILVPFARAYLRRVDIANKCVEMELPEGLLDINK
jgi:16S rRNA processing protein RimM